jgi:hypothetical protein
MGPKTRLDLCYRKHKLFLIKALYSKTADFVARLTENFLFGLPLLEFGSWRVSFR